MQSFSIRDNYKEIENLYLHDSELDVVSVDYKSKEVKILFKTPVINEGPSKRIEFTFVQVNDFHCPMKEPWGSGFYLHSLSVEKLSNLHLKTTFLLNSGDEVTCTAKLVKTSI